MYTQKSFPQGCKREGQNGEDDASDPKGIINDSNIREGQVSDLETKPAEIPFRA